MERVYFDKQIFSHLFKQDNIFYQKMLDEILHSKEHLLFCYSHAHLLDLKNDKTEIKYKELAFMKQIVDDNYISYHATEKKTSCYLAEPLEAFKQIDGDDNIISFSNLFDSINLSNATPEQVKQIEQAKDFLNEQTLDFGLSAMQNMPEGYAESLGRILPVDLGPISMMDWIERFAGFIMAIQEDKSIYKGLRNLVDTNLNNGKFTIEYESVDFNDDLKNSLLKKSFLDFVNASLNPKGDKQISDYDFHTNAYFMLDLLGISKEPAKTVRFKNMLNDGIHSYYGAFCDYVVSDDIGFMKKSKALYRLLGIDTKVYSVEEFASRFTLLRNSFEADSNTFVNLLIHDLETGLVLGSKKSIRFDRETIFIKPTHKYINYFNTIESIIEENKRYILFRKKSRNYSDFDFFREYKAVVDSLIKLFGHDVKLKGRFDLEEDVLSIRNGNWDGRVWDLGSMTLLLEINESIKEFCMLLASKK